ncbi:hypothetical protein SH611_11720 [Geminicoccaceae bacterium 1502E]|nr:hypothetical protein [Geminicoccaceae bacterium 1502E]
MPHSPTRYRNGHEDAFDWVSRALANVLGVGTARLPVRRDRPLRAASEAEVGLLARQVEGRFQRRVDPATGAVHYERVGPAIAIEVGEVRVEELAQRAAAAIPAVRAALAGIDPEEARVEVRPETVRTLLDAAIADLDRLRGELEGDPAELYVDALFSGLLADPGGLLVELMNAFSSLSGAETLQAERQAKAIEIAAEGLFCLQRAWNEWLGDEEGLAVRVGFVERCASHIGDQVVLIRGLLADEGIGRCELEAVIVDFGGNSLTVGEPPFERRYDRLPFGQLLAVAERESRRWPALAGLGGSAQLDAVGRSARMLAELLDRLAPDELVRDELRLRGEEADAAEAALLRLVGLAASFARSLGGKGKGAGYGKPPSGGSSPGQGGSGKKGGGGSGKKPGSAAASGNGEGTQESAPREDRSSMPPA